MKKKLAVGGDVFADMIRGNCYYVDKTLFIRTIMESESKVLLMTRPRRFGKTLFMDTLKTFLQINPAEPGDRTGIEPLFEGLRIQEDADFCRQFMGQYPTVFLSLKNAEGPTFEDAYKAFARMLVNVAKELWFLEESPRLLPEDKKLLRRYRDLDYMRDRAHKDDVQAFLRDVMTLLSQHFQRKVVLLIDEYDVPLAKAAVGGYYDDMLPLIRGFLGEALKANPNTGYDATAYLKKAVLTGCLRVSKESIFTGINNPEVNTVCSSDVTLAQAIGFTTDEVKSLLDYYGLTARYDDVRQWYDGYRFCREEMYCPWDVINFADQALRSEDALQYEPGNYWEKTSGNEVIQEFLGFLTSEDADRMQTLVDGGSIDITINEKLTYSDFSQHNSEDFWTLLLFTGYLTVEAPVKGQLDTYRLRIPNEEIRDTFEKNVRALYSKKNRQYVRYGENLSQAFLSGQADAVRRILLPLLRRYVSVRDEMTKAPPENYYHGFLSALLVCAGEAIEGLHSNPEAGDGYADLVFTSPDMDVGVVIEVKRCREPSEMQREAKAALCQIKTKHYAQIFEEYGCATCYGFGMAFCRKLCVVTVEKLECSVGYPPA